MANVLDKCSVRISLSANRPPNLVVIISHSFCRSRVVSMAVLGLSLFILDILLCHGEITSMTVMLFLNPKCVTLFHNIRRRRERGFWRPIAPSDHIFPVSSVSTGWAAFGLLPRPLCFKYFFFMDSIVETSSNSVAEKFSRSKLLTAGGHGRSRKYHRKPLRQVCNVPGSYSLPLFSFAVCLISRNKCLRNWGTSCFEIASRLIYLPCFSFNQDCKRRTDVLVRFLVFFETILSLKETSS